MPQWVTLLPEACTGAVCALCQEHKDGLLKCSRCKRAWYCCKEHQKEHYPEHKMTCRITAPFVDALIESVADIRPPPSSYAAVQTLVASATLYATRHGPRGSMGNNIFSCLSNTVFCRVCFKLREQLPPGCRMECCPKCLWGWCCSEHWKEYQPQHEPHCAEYATMRRMGVLMRQQAQLGLTGCNQLPFPMGKVTQDQQGQLLEGWEAYRRLRVASVRNDDTWRCMTDDLAVPLTAVWSSRLMYSQEQLAAVKEFNLHLVGAANFELHHVVASTAIEEVLHLLPAVEVLRVVVVGPEYKVITQGPTCSTFQQDVCPPCSKTGCKRILSIYRGTYEDYAKSKDWNEPTLALACNSGVGCEDQGSWSQAVKVLAAHKTPCCFTSMNAGEVELDVKALKEGGMTILHQGCNTFSSLVPLRDMDAGPDEFYYTNGYVICCRAEGDGNTIGASSSSSSSSAS